MTNFSLGCNRILASAPNMKWHRKSLMRITMAPRTRIVKIGALLLSQFGLLLALSFQFFGMVLRCWHWCNNRRPEEIAFPSSRRPFRFLESKISAHVKACVSVISFPRKQNFCACQGSPFSSVSITCLLTWTGLGFSARASWTAAKAESFPMWSPIWGFVSEAGLEILAGPDRVEKSVRAEIRHTILPLKFSNKNTIIEGKQDIVYDNPSDPYGRSWASLSRFLSEQLSKRLGVSHLWQVIQFRLVVVIKFVMSNQSV